MFGNVNREGLNERLVQHRFGDFAEAGDIG
jgi:hypothetical protein